MWIGWTEFDILLGDVHSLKEKRSVVRPLLAELSTCNRQLTTLSGRSRSTKRPLAITGRVM